MTRYFLDSVTIEGFRGINNVNDPLKIKFREDAVNSIHAPNGAGKSSIFEALHYCIHGTVPRLEELQEAEHGEAYVVNKFHPQNRATIDLAFKSDDATADVAIQVSRSADGIKTVNSPSGHPDPESFLASLREDFVLVDYPSFASFVNCSALDRGRSFSSLVGLSRYSRLRQQLERARNTQNINTDLGLSNLDRQVTRKARDLDRIEQRIRTHFEAITSTTLPNGIKDTVLLKTVVTAALAEVPIFAPLLVDATVTELNFDAAGQLIDEAEGGTARKELDELQRIVTPLSDLRLTQEESAEFDGLLALAKSRDRSMREVGTADIHALLKDALSVVTSDEWRDPQLCPVCDTPSDSPLADRLMEKIAKYDAAEQLDSELTDQAKTISYLSKLRQLEEHIALNVNVADRISVQITAALRDASIATTVLELGKEQMLSLDAQREQIVVAALAKIEEIEANLPQSLVEVTRMLNHAKQFRDEVDTYETELPLQAARKKKLSKLNRWKSFITSASQEFATAESTLTNARLVAIQTRCQALFGRLVRGGPDMRPSLKRAQNTERIDLTLSDFFGLHDLSARALLSESYRNAVAASIFLSAAVQHGGVPRFMVLDDVTSSFDAGHQFGLMEIIRSNLRHGAVGVNDGIQFIILSHDTSLEKYFDRLNGTLEWHHQKLQGMPPKGMLTAATQQANRLRAHAQSYLSNGQIEVGEPFLRQYLEYKLGQIISKLEIPVPPDYVARGDKRTLSTYLNSINQAVTIYQEAGRCILSAQQIADLQNQHVPSIMTNYVSHYETNVGTPFNAYTLLGVLQSIDELENCFTWTDPTDNLLKFYRRLDRR